MVHLVFEVEPYIETQRVYVHILQGNDMETPVRPIYIVCSNMEPVG